VVMHANGDAGWNFDDGNDDPMGAGAQVNAQYLTVEYSGCTEEYPITHAVPIGICYDQAANYAGYDDSSSSYYGSNGGWAYGDGIGTSDTQLSFTCDHCNFNHNTQDGFDLLHTSGSIISITNSVSYANEGQQFKLGPMNQITFKNNVVVGNCHRMASAITGGTPGYNAGIHEAPDNGSNVTASWGLCRADATAVAISMSPTGTFTFQNNTVISYGDIQWGLSCQSGADCSGAHISYENNINIAYPYPSALFSKVPVSLYFESGTAGSGWKSRSNNIFTGFRNPICPTGFSNESCTADPMFTSAPSLTMGSYTDDTIFDNMDLHLRSSSPAKGAGVSIPGLTLNYEANAVSNPPNLGAY
jgi:hypothetical protein